MHMFYKCDFYFKIKKSIYSIYATSNVPLARTEFLSAKTAFNFW